MALKAKMELAATVLGVANNLGVPMDVFGAVFGSGPDPLDEIKEAIAQLQEVVQDVNQNNQFREINQALQESNSAFLTISNPGALSSAKASALTGASKGLSDVAGAVSSLLNSQSGALTPQIVQKLYEALAFSLSVQVNVAGQLAWGEKIGGVYQHGGFMAVETVIQRGIDALREIETVIRDTYGQLFISNLFVAVDENFGRYSVVFKHKINNTNEATDHYRKVLTEVLPEADQRLFDADFFRVREDTVQYFFPKLFSLNFTPERILEGSRVASLISEIEKGVSGLAISTLTGEKVPREPGQIKLYSWNDDSAFEIDELIAAAEATIDGIFVESSGTLNGSEGGDYLRGRSNNDRLNGFGGDDYLFGGDGDDFMFGGEGSDRYFGGGGNDAMIDEGASTDTDVAVFEGDKNDYAFFDDTGSLGLRIVVFNKANGDKNILRGIEILKFDDDAVNVATLPLQPRSVSTPVIAGISRDTGASDSDGITSDDSLTLSGTADANSIVELIRSNGSIVVAATVANAAGTWEFPANVVSALNDLSDGRYEFIARGSNATGFNTSNSDVFVFTIDKTAPTVLEAELTSSGGASAPARPGDTVTLTFVMNEALGALPEVTLAGSTATVRDLGRGDFRAQVTLAESAPTGAVSFEISATDLAGNAATANATTDGSSLTIEVAGADETLRGGGEADTLTGGRGDDRLLGRGGDDRLDGGRGDDFLNGGPGDDVLLGRAGDDTLVGGGGTDRLVGGGGRDLMRGGGGNDVLLGQGGADTLVGGGVNDRLVGGGGNDELRGGAGRDTLEGGAGSDRFVFRRGDGRDVVLDFRDGRDLIHIETGARDFRQLGITERGGDVVIDYGRRGDLIRLRNTDADDLDAGDFMFG